MTVASIYRKTSHRKENSDIHRRHGQRWGSWRLDAVRLCFLYEQTIDGHSRVIYEIDLETCRDSSSVLDWICQISGKGWGCASVADFVKALRDLVDPQENFCSFAIWGGPKSHRYVPFAKMKAFLRERIAKPTEAEAERTWAWAYGSEIALTPWLENEMIANGAVR